MTAGRAVLLVVALYAAFWLGHYAGARRLPRTSPDPLACTRP